MNLLKTANYKERFFIKNIRLTLLTGLLLAFILCRISEHQKIYGKDISYQILFDNEIIGLINDESDVYEVYLQLEYELKELKNRNIQIENKIDTEPATTIDENAIWFDKDTLYNTLKDKITYSVEAYELTIDGEVIGVINSEQEARNLLADIASEYIELYNEGDDDVAEASAIPITVGVASLNAITINNIVDIDSTNILDKVELTSVAEEVDINNDTPIEVVPIEMHFEQDISGESIFVPEDEIMLYQEMEMLLASNKTQPVKYTVAEGDNISTVAEQNNMTISEIKELNPQISDINIIMPDEEIILEEATPVLETEVTEKAIFLEKIPAEIEYKPNSEMFDDEEKTILQGEDGYKEINVQITKVNGKEVSREVIDEKIIKEPTKTIIEHGTKKKAVARSNGSGPSVSTSDKGLFMHPLNGEGVFTSGYGPRWGSFHGGIDFGAPAGTPIYAADDGTVTYSSWNNGGYGYLVIIDHGNGYETYYAHNSKNYVNVGDKVSKGDNIATVGSTGDSTGNHIHFEIRLNGSRQDPYGYLF
ncbi:hypothetical protein AN641_09860 [Candidatus Epulonipiscioides gigas]|nr:hypothetical protein AN641_09860 [Epulopiscium sp. SCG-C07WGA-EpuloA2]